MSTQEALRRAADRLRAQGDDEGAAEVEAALDSPSGEEVTPEVIEAATDHDVAVIEAQAEAEVTVMEAAAAIEEAREERAAEAEPAVVEGEEGDALDETAADLADGIPDGQADEAPEPAHPYFRPLFGRKP